MSKKRGASAPGEGRFVSAKALKRRKQPSTRKIDSYFQKIAEPQKQNVPIKPNQLTLFGERVLLKGAGPPAPSSGRNMPKRARPITLRSQASNDSENGSNGPRASSSSVSSSSASSEPRAAADHTRSSSSRTKTKTSAPKSSGSKHKSTINLSSGIAHNSEAAGDTSSSNKKRKRHRSPPSSSHVLTAASSSSKRSSASTKHCKPQLNQSPDVSPKAQASSSSSSGSKLSSSSRHRRDKNGRSAAPPSSSASASSSSLSVSTSSRDKNGRMKKRGIANTSVGIRGDGRRGAKHSSMSSPRTFDLSAHRDADSGDPFRFVASNPKESHAAAPSSNRSPSRSPARSSSPASRNAPSSSRTSELLSFRRNRTEAGFTDKPDQDKDVDDYERPPAKRLRKRKRRVTLESGDRADSSSVLDTSFQISDFAISRSNSGSKSGAVPTPNLPRFHLPAEGQLSVSPQLPTRNIARNSDDTAEMDSALEAKGDVDHNENEQDAEESGSETDASVTDPESEPEETANTASLALNHSVVDPDLQAALSPLKHTIAPELDDASDHECEGRTQEKRAFDADLSVSLQADDSLLHSVAHHLESQAENTPPTQFAPITPQPRSSCKSKSDKVSRDNVQSPYSFESQASASKNDPSGSSESPTFSLSPAPKIHLRQSPQPSSNILARRSSISPSVRDSQLVHDSQLPNLPETPLTNGPYPSWMQTQNVQNFTDSPTF